MCFKKKKSVKCGCGMNIHEFRQRVSLASLKPNTRTYYPQFKPCGNDCKSTETHESYEAHRALDKTLVCRSTCDGEICKSCKKIPKKKQTKIEICYDPAYRKYYPQIG